MSKIFSMWAEAFDVNGGKHIVTIVGEFTQKNVPTTEVHRDTNGNVVATTLVESKKKERSLMYACSICHPDDTFNEEVGKHVALRRVRKNPMGGMTTDMITTLCEDQCKLILFGELQHVVNNIDHYIEKL